MKEHLRCHVAGSAWCIVRIIGSVNSCDTEVRQLQVPILVDHQIFRFNISMNNLVLVNVLESRDEASNKELCGALIKGSMRTDMKSQITAWEVVHDEVEVIPILECIVHIDQEGII